MNEDSARPSSVTWRDRLPRSSGEGLVREGPSAVVTVAPVPPIVRRPLQPGHKHVVVIGGGFAGLAAARVLAGEHGVAVTLVDKRNHHLFQPLLYQVATAGLNPADIAVPIRSEFTDAANVEVHLAEVEHINLEAHWIEGAGVRLPYDYLVVACGAVDSYYGHDDWQTFAPSLKSLEQATEIRRRILTAFELAENELDPVRQRALLSFVVVGGGPTGVELAGAIADISRTVLQRDFRRIDPRAARVSLVEAGPRILAAFPPDLSERATRDLQTLGVEVRTGQPVRHIDASGIRLPEENIEAATVLWAAGVRAAPLVQVLGVELDPTGRVSVARDLSLPDHPEVFVVGDVAKVVLEDGEVVPGLAPAALQMGRAAASNVLASIRGEPRRPFHYVDKGIMATIGKHKAVAAVGRLRLTGFLAWLAWVFIHVLYLVGFKNRVAVVLSWAWSYGFSKRGARLITMIPPQQQSQPPRALGGSLTT